MARKRYFCFKFEGDPNPHWLTPSDAYAKAESENLKIIKDGYRTTLENPVRVRDGFQAGYQPGLGEYAGGPREYAKKCREKGLVEMGREKINQTTKETNFVDHELKKDLSKIGMSDREIDAID